MTTCKQSIIVALVIACLFPCFVHAAEPLETEKIDAFVTGYLERNGLPGASIAVVQDGATVYENGYGHDSEGNPITAHSRMRIGSVSKSFTAFAVLQLVDAGKVKLDDPVIKYLPELRMNDARFQQVTVRQLLSHTSGMPDPIIVAPANTVAEGAERIRNWELRSDPGTKHAYSNANYWVLAYMVENVSGLAFSDYLHQEIFSPLGMHDSLGTVTTRDPVSGLSSGHVTAYGTAFPWTELEAMTAGAGGVVATASDMGKWLSMLTSDGEGESGEQLVSVELMKEAFSPQPGSERYGLGWSLSAPDVEPARISHSGVLTTFQAQQDIVPSGGYAVAVLLNSFTPTYEHAYAISSGIIQLAEGYEPERKAPQATIIDLSLGIVTLLYAALGIRGILRSKKWAETRRAYPTWKFSLRLVPQLIPALAIGWLFFIVPSLKNNSATTMDAFGLWPAFMLLLAVIFVCGTVLTIARTYHLRKW